jgi:hypothetical protein
MAISRRKLHIILGFIFQPVKSITKYFAKQPKNGQMKRFIILLALVLFAAAGCQKKKPADYTRLGDFTPYQSYMEKLNGKVETVTEKGYWAIPEGDTYIKGASITRKELDSIGYTYDYTAIFDIDGDLVSCTTNDENGTVINTWRISKVNNVLASAEYESKDTIRYRVEITCDEGGNPVLFVGYDAVADTLDQKIEIIGSEISDTLLVQYYDYRGEPNGKALQIFNELGLLTDSWNIGKDGTPGTSYTFIYNDKGFQSEGTFLDKDKNVAGKIYATYEYDEMGNWIKVTCKDQKGFTVINERVYTYFE